MMLTTSPTKAPVISVLLKKIASSALRDKFTDDDFIDQLNHWASTGILTALALGIGAKQYVGDPIHCWVPAQYKKKHYQKYSDSYCWIHPMYSFSFDDAIPVDPADRWYNDISYYRWVFIMFLLQAFLFKFPNMVWKNLKNLSGLNVSNLIGMAWDTHMLTQEKRDEKMDHMAIFIDQWLKTYSQYKYSVLTRFRDRFSYFMFCFGRRSGTYLRGLYMFVKMLYFINIIGQFFLLSAFLDLNFWTFGLTALATLRKQGNWQDQYNFPRIGLCDYKIRQLENMQTFTVQCVLSINLFLEKMYLLLWFWFIVVLVFDSINLCQWVFRGLQPNSGQSFLNKYFILLEIDPKKEKKLFVKFVHSYLRPDGIFVLRIMAVNTSEILILDLIRHLWKRFKDNYSVTDDQDDVVAPNGGSPVSPSAPALEENDFGLPPKKIQ